MTEKADPNQLCLGYGTSGIMGAAATNKGRLSLLDCAFQLGIRHFDTAPLYGQGDAEKIVGRFATNKRDKVTIATKFGLFPRKLNPILRSALPVARYINRRRIKRNSNLTYTTSDQIRVGKYEVIDPPILIEDFGGDVVKIAPKLFESQLSLSLNKLRSEYVDFLFLHDLSCNHLSDALVSALMKAKTEGKIRQLGLATSRAKALAIANTYPEIDFVAQVQSPNPQWRSEPLDIGQPKTFYHSFYKQNVDWQLNWLTANWEKLRRSVPALDSIQANPFGIAIALSIHMSMRKIDNGISLFSSGHKQHIVENVRALNVATELMDELSKSLAELSRP